MSPENTAGPSILQWALGALATIFGPLILVLSGGIVQIRDQTRDNTQRIASLEATQASTDRKLDKISEDTHKTRETIVRLEGRLQ